MPELVDTPGTNADLGISEGSNLGGTSDPEQESSDVQNGDSDSFHDHISVVEKDSEDVNIHVNLINLDPAPLMTVPITIVGNNVRALVDTGATLSLVKQSLVLPESIYDDDEFPTIIGLGGNSVKSLGRVDLSFWLGSVELFSSFLVVPDNVSKHSVILGHNFFLQHCVTVNLSSHQLSGRAGSSTWTVYLDSDGCHTQFRNVSVYAQRDTVIEGFDPVLVPVTCNSLISKSDSNTEYYFDGGKFSDNAVFEYVQGEEGVVSFEDGKANVLLLKTPNGTKPKERIKASQVVGYISTIVDVFVSCPEVNVVSDATSDLPDPLANISLEGLTAGQATAVMAMLQDNREVFSLTENDVGCAGVTQHKIELHDETPIRQLPRRFPAPVNDELERQCEELLQMNVLQYSKSSWCSPIVPIRKKDGTLRMCIDYRKLNCNTKADRFPIPSMNDLIFGLHGMQFFSSLDLKKGYYQVPLHPDSMEYTAFSTASNHYEFCRLPFGLKNAPGAFQREMQEVLREFNRKQVVIYIDDIATYHVSNLRRAYFSC